MTRWIVLLDSAHGRYAYGPIDDAEHADKFAEFMTREVDPAEPVKLVDPIDELLNFTRRPATRSEDRPMGWPPRPGDVWEDRDGNRWVCSRVPGGTSPYLVCLARQADDSAEEIWRLFGPMSQVRFIAPTKDEEAPF